MSSITLHGIAPATFRVVLRFMCTDVFPGDDELAESPSEMVQHLLAAADQRCSIHRHRPLSGNERKRVTVVRHAP
jgi:hypothetical protein